MSSLTTKSFHRKSTILMTPCLRLPISLRKVVNRRPRKSPLLTAILTESGDDSDSGDDVEMGGVTQNFHCPLTLTSLVNPVTSLVFGVLYVNQLPLICLFFHIAMSVGTAFPKMPFRIIFARLEDLWRSALPQDATRVSGLLIVHRMQHWQRGLKFTSADNERLKPTARMMMKSWIESNSYLKFIYLKGANIF